MEQFSHDLSLALEESRITGSRTGRWTARRRTRSTGNLPCAPQPTEDSSSSPEDGAAHFANGPLELCASSVLRIAANGDTQVLSDSDNAATGDPGCPTIPGGANQSRGAVRFPLSTVRPDVSLGNFESDSLNENFSPARPCARRKRKFKRMAVEYDTPTATTLSSAPIHHNNRSGSVSSTANRGVIMPGNSFFAGVGVSGCAGASLGGGGLHHHHHHHHLSNNSHRTNARYGASYQENCRANLFFCGKRKRSHRDRYDYDHHRMASSVPKHRDFFSNASGVVGAGGGNGAATLIMGKGTSFLHHGNASNLSEEVDSMTQKIQPLNQNIISRIEKIAQDSAAAAGGGNATTTVSMGRIPRPECEFKPIDPVTMVACDEEEEHGLGRGAGGVRAGAQREAAEEEEDTLVASDLRGSGISVGGETNNNISIPSTFGMDVVGALSSIGGCKSGSLESNFSFQEYGSGSGNSGLGGAANHLMNSTKGEPQRNTKRHHTRRHHRHKRSAMGMQLQFDDPASFMDCPMADILSSSSLSSSDSETDKTCDSDREGDDELTDWPGNEGTVGFPGSVDFKRTKSQKMMGSKGLGGGGALPLIKSDEDTRMSAEEVQIGMRMQPVVLPLKPGFVPVTMPLASVTPPPGFLNRAMPSMPIDMPMSNSSGGGLMGGSNVMGVVGGGGVGGGDAGGGYFGGGITGGPQIESELSGETSNPFLSSPNTLNEVREFRAGCRRVREERPSFSVITSVNEDLSRFLQDGRQTQLNLPDTDALEHEKLSHLAKLYSLHMRVDRGMAVLTKTSNTTQPVRVNRSNMAKRYLSDFKRRCYEDGQAAADVAAEASAAMMMTEEQEMNDIQS